MTLGQRIRQLRKARLLTVTTLAQQIGVHRNTLANWEAGRSEPDASELVRLAVALTCFVADLLKETSPPRPESS